MLTFAQAEEELNLVGREVAGLPYDLLCHLAESADDQQALVRIKTVEGQPITLFPIISRLGRVRKRIAIEVSIEADGVSGRICAPCYYAVRYPDGTIEESHTRTWHIVVIGVLVLIGTGAVLYSTLRWITGSLVSR